MCVWSYSGVRPLLEDEATDPPSVTRDYALELDPEPAPLLSVFGGKITTYRRLAEEAVTLLCRAPAAGSRAVDRRRRCCRAGTCPRAASRCSCAPSSGSYPWLPTRMRLR